MLAVEHSDALHVTYEGGVLGLGARIGNAPDDEYADPAELIYQVVDSADTRLTVPADDRYAFLGPAGATTWIAPQVQKPGVVWPGWDTEAIAPGALAGDVVTIAMAEVSGPGTVEVFQTLTTGPDRIFSSTDPAMTLDQAVGAHVHANWAFSALGTYELTFTVTARPAGSATELTTGPVTYAFVVGDLPPDATTTTTSTTSTTVPGSSTTSTTTTTTTTTATSTSTTSTTTTTVPAGGRCTGLEVVLDDGHIDIAARLVDGELRTQLKDTTLAPTPVYWRDLATVGLHVTDGARAQVPSGAAYRFLGEAGDPVWLLPQSQKMGILWPGWNTEAIDYSQLSGPVTWSLDEVTGPGKLAVYELGSLGDVAVVFDSDEALPQTLALPMPTHAHGNWVFTEPGIYHLTFSHRATSAGGRALHSEGTIAVAVGDVDLAGLCPGGDVPPPGGGHGGDVDPGPNPPGPAAVRPAGRTNLGDGAAPWANGADSPTCAPVSMPASAAAPSTAPPSTAAPAAPVVLDDGHIDYGVRIVDGRLRSLVKDGTVAGRTDWREPSQAVLHLLPAAATEVPGTGFGFLGDPGSTVWQVPQTQKPGIIWLGWNTEELSAGEVRGTVRWTLDRIDGPGDLAVFEYDSFGSPQVIFTTRDGVGDSYQVPLGTHAHGNWAFTAEGAYRITFTHSATLVSGETVSDTQTLLMAVGDTDPAALAPAAAPAAAAPAADRAPATVVVTGADGCPRLARTGAEVLPPLRIAGVLLVAGALAVVATRRHRTVSP